MMEKLELPDLTGNVAEFEIYRAAKVMIGFFQGDAGHKAALTAEQFRGEGDLNGFKVWRRIIEAIAHLQATRNTTG
jgi:hypothetical protein